MKILFVIDTFETNNNGTSISAQRYAAELRRRGHEVRILATGDSDTIDYKLPEYTIPVFQPLVNKHGFQFAAVDKQVIASAISWADVVHCFMPFGMEMYTAKTAIKQGIPCTGAFHIQPENIWSSVGLGKISWIQDLTYRISNRIYYRRFKHIHVPSKFMGRMLAERKYKSKIHVISNGIQNDFIEAGKRKAAKQEEPVDSNKKEVLKVMMIGRLAREKRQDVIINAIKFSKYADKIQLVFAGRGPLYEKYVELGKQLKNPPQFIYVGRDELIQHLLSTDLYIHASDMESEAISCIEAFATGLVPVIANSDLSATPQFALDGRSLFIPGNPKDLARAMDYWFDHPREKQYMEELYRQSARKYTLKNCVAQFEEMLEEELADHQEKPKKRSKK